MAARSSSTTVQWVTRWARVAAGFACYYPSSYFSGNAEIHVLKAVPPDHRYLLWNYRHWGPVEPRRPGRIHWTRILRIGTNASAAGRRRETNTSFLVKDVALGGIYQQRLSTYYTCEG